MKHPQFPDEFGAKPVWLTIENGHLNIRFVNIYIYQFQLRNGQLISAMFEGVVVLVENKKDKRMVKGTMLVDYIRLIRGRKDIPWEKHLTKEDMEIIKGRILPMGWYPFETFQRCGIAVLHEVAKDDLNVVRQWGRLTMKNLIENTYPILAKSKDVFETFHGLQNIRSRFFSFAAPTFEKIGPKSIRVTFENTPNEKGLEAFCYQHIGGYDYLIELYGGKNVRLTWEKKAWDGDNCVSFVFTWD